MIVKANPYAIKKFIQSAPDAKAPATTDQRVAISHRLLQSKLDALDVLATKSGVKRASLINLAIDQLLERGVTMGGRADD